MRLSTLAVEGRWQVWAVGPHGAIQLMRTADPDVESATAVGDVVYFTNVIGNSRTGLITELWKTDGTPGGTMKMTNLPSAMRSPIRRGRRLFFSSGSQLWVTNGTRAGTHSFFDGAGVGNALLSGDLVFFTMTATVGSATHTDLWCTDLTAAGTREVAADFRAIDSAAEYGWQGGMLYPTRQAPDYSQELWFVDRAGHQQEIPGSDGQPAVDPTILGTIGGSLVLRAKSNGSSGIWSASAPDQPLAPIAVQSGGGAPYAVAAGMVPGKVLYVSNDTLYAAALNGVQALRLAQGYIQAESAGDVVYYTNFGFLDVSDGTVGGSFGIAGVAPSSFLAASNGTVWYVNGGHAYIGDSSGVAQLPDVITNASSNPQDLTNVNGTLYFTADDGVHGRELFKAVPGAAPVLAADLNPGPGSSNPQQLVAVGDALYFLASAAGVSQLFKADASGVYPVELPASVRPSAPLVGLRDAVYFQATASGGSGSEYGLWRSDGTTGGTSLVKQLGADRRGILGMAVFQSHLFIATPSALWRSNGNPAGTVKHLKMEAQNLTPSDDWLYFTVERQTRMWATTLDPNQTRVVVKPDPVLGHLRLQDLTVAGGKLYYTAGSLSYSTAEAPPMLYCIGPDDRTARLVVGSRDQHPLVRGHNVSELVARSDGLFFQADHQYSTAALWFSDGTAAGTMPVVNDLVSDLTLAGPDLYFVSGRPSGYWDVFAYSKGAITSVHPAGYVSGAPGELTSVGGTMYFAASDGIDGEELWAVYPPHGAIKGTVFDDANRDGVLDSGEKGLAGYRVFLDLNQNGRWDDQEPSVRTNSHGAYRLDWLDLGHYTVRVVPVEGTAATSANPSAAQVREGKVVTRNFGRTTS